jgi:predicted phosphodiesterase
MDIAVFADIHGNHVALERCLEYAFSRNISTFFFLGDYIGELAYPERTMKLLYDLKDSYYCFFVKGNKEDYWLQYRAGGEKGWEKCSSTSGSLLYAYNSLTDRDLDFFEQLQPVQMLQLDEMPAITICHGSPYSINEKIQQNDNRTIEVMRRVTTPVTLCGHTHVQTRIEQDGKCIFNPGAVGVPLFSNGQTQFLILHGADGVWTEEFISLEYDVDRVIRELYEANLNVWAPYWSLITEYILRGGNTPHGQILSRAIKLCRDETGDCVWPDIPEKYWAQAVNEYIPDGTILRSNYEKEILT